VGQTVAGVGGVGGKGLCKPTTPLFKSRPAAFFIAALVFGGINHQKEGQKVAVGRNLLPSIQPRSALTK